MKKLLSLCIFAAVLVSCGGSGTRYLGKDMTGMDGLLMPCISGQPDIFSVEGNRAVFSREMYNVIIKFNCGVSVVGDPCFNVYFKDTTTNEVVGKEVQIMFNRTTQMDGWLREVKAYNKGDYRILPFYINSIETSDAGKLEKANLAVIEFLPDGFYKSKSDRLRHFYYFPEAAAIDFQEAFYDAIVTNDMEKYDGVDYGCGEFDAYDGTDWNYYNRAYELWKVLNPQKWAVIRDFRKQKIKEGHLLVIVDTEDANLNNPEG